MSMSIVQQFPFLADSFCRKVTRHSESLTIVVKVSSGETDVAQFDDIFFNLFWLPDEVGFFPYSQIGAAGFIF
jgi:hypothetical protein